MFYLSNKTVNSTNLGTIPKMVDHFVGSLIWDLLTNDKLSEARHSLTLLFRGQHQAVYWHRVGAQRTLLNGDIWEPLLPSALNLLGTH